MVFAKKVLFDEKNLFFLKSVKNEGGQDGNANINFAWPKPNPIDWASGAWTHPGRVPAKNIMGATCSCASGVSVRGVAKAVWGV